MFLCFICKNSYDTVRALIRHLKLSHAFYPNTRFQLVCDQNGCNQRFSTFSGFRKHLLKKHHNGTQSDTSSLSISTLPPSLPDQQLESSYTAESHEKSNDDETRPSPTKVCGLIVGDLLCGDLPASKVKSFVNKFERFVDISHTNIKDDVLNLLPPDNEVLKDRMNDYFENLRNPVVNFNTETKWKKYYSEKLEMVEPTEIALGVRFDSRRNRSFGTYDQVPVTDKFVYVPILQTLKFIFSNKDICRHFVQPADSSGVYRDFCDGSYFKNHPLFSKNKNALQIQLFFDEFETANPLGSKHGIHKVGSIYFILRNFTPKINSALLNIHLVALFHSQDIKNYGINAILEPIVHDLKVLESTGISLPFCDQQICGTVAQVTGDNLGLHTVLGFVESFSARYFCRFCIADKNECQRLFTDDYPNKLRNEVLHAQHCSHVHDPTVASSFGVKRMCILNNLQYFSVVDNYAVDLMHDILEGVGQFELKLLFGYLAENKIVSKQDVTERVYAFNYGYLERKNRPSRLNLDQTGNGIGLNAIQTFCLIRNVPLIFGDIVPGGNAHWRLLLLLLQIINVVFSPVITEGMTVCLKHLIIDHHKLFKELYPHRNLIPKHHFLVHYPSAIRKIGPLIHFWGMRFEAKHRFFKDAVKNFKNITKSLAQKHQMTIAHHWESEPLKSIACGPTKTVTVGDLKNGDVISDSLHVGINCEIDVVSWITCYGTEYCPGLLVCSKVEDGIPVFSQINDIVMFSGKYFLAVNDFETLGFCEHLHSYNVMKGNEYDAFLLEVDELQFFKPFDLQAAYGVDTNDLYVVPVHVFL